MNHTSSKALAWTAGILMVLALVIMSPSGAFALLVLAALCSAIPALFAAKRPRIVSMVLLGASLALAARFYPEFMHEQKAYRHRAKERSTQPQVTTPSNQGVNRR
jgi:membrane protein implicated in regulation of membrane protease activity